MRKRRGDVCRRSGRPDRRHPFRSHVGRLVCGVFVLVCCGESLAVRVDPALELTLSRGIGDRAIGDVVFVTVTMSDLGMQEAAGWQGFIEYDTANLVFLCGTYTPEPFGLAVIDPIAGGSGVIDLASGIDVAGGQGASSDDAELAVLQFAVLTPGCVEGVSFRAHEPPTRLTDALGNEIGPLTLVDLPAQVPCEPSPCQADYNEDWAVNSLDFIVYLNLFVVGDSRADFNGDCVVDSLDFVAYLNAFVQGCY